MTATTPTLRVVVAGASGRLGRVAVEAIEAAPDLALVATYGRGDDLDALLALEPDVLVDATLAQASRSLAPRAARAGVRPVVGVSGLTDDDREALAHACAEGGVGGLIVPNFSLGAALALRAAEWIAEWLPCLGIDERHHLDKRDAPSGTALDTARRIAAASRDGTRPPITFERLDGVLAEHGTTFGTPAQTLRIEHVVRDPRAYAPGIVLAVRAVMDQRGLGLGLDSLLGRP